MRVKVKEKNNKRHTIKSSLIDRIRDWAPDSQLPTERELCEEFQVSRMTVNKALSELVDEKLLYRVQGRGTFVGCRPGGKRTILFIGNRSDWNSQPLAHTQTLFMKLQNLAYSDNINVELLDVDAQRKEYFNQDALARLCSKDQIFLCHNHLHIPEMYERLTESGCKVTYMCYDTEISEVFRPFRKNWHVLFFDRKTSTKNAIKYLASKGRKKFALLNYVCHPAEPHMTGFREAIIETGLEFEANLIEPTPNSVASAFLFCKNLLLLRRIYDFDALITSHADIAIGAQQALKDSGISIPDDIALLSMEDSERLQDNIMPVTAVSKPEDLILKRTLEIFSKNLYEPGKLETYIGKFEERNTT